MSESHEPVELVLAAPAAGGGMVARLPDGRVVFVRHGLPGERVRAVVTEDHATWARADAVEVLDPSADRVAAPCPYAGPGGCGGCDYQHVALPAQRDLKRARVLEQLRVVGGLDRDVTVAAVGPDRRGLATRTRVRFAVDADGGLAMRRHHGHELVSVARCALAVPAIDALDLASRRWQPGADVEAVALTGAASPTVAVTVRDGGATTLHVLDDDALAPSQSTVVDDVEFCVSAGVFWQVHERGPDVLVTEVLAGLALGGGERVVDLCCGAGLFTAACARAVGPTGSVVGLDASAAAVDDARRNLAPWPWARARHGRLDARTVRDAARGATHAVLDPPRRGVARDALRALCELPALRRVVSVSCDPATFARDLRRLCAAGFEVERLAAFDLFEMTEHTELVAVLSRP